MILTPGLAEEAELVLNSEDQDLIRSWFHTWSSEDEMVDKVLLWGHTFMPTYFRDPSPQFHRDLISRFFSNQNEYVAAPRGFSKTTVVQLCTSFSVANKLDKFIVVVEKTFFEASELISAIHSVFIDPYVKTIYGSTVSVDEGGDEDETAREARGDLLINGVRIRAKGFNTSLRGMKSKAYRPTRIILDDVEEDEHINSEDQRKKYFKNYVSGVLPALDVGCHVKMFGTILHMDSLLNTMIKSHDGVIYSAWDRSSGRDPAQSLLWPERWSYDRLMEKKREMEASNKPTSDFWREYFNDPVSNDERAFKWDWLQKEYDEKDLLLKNLTTVIAIDVADSTSDSADYTGIVVVSIDDQGNWFIRHVRRVRCDIKELIETVFSLYDTWKPLRIGIEKRAFEDQVLPLLRERMEQLRLYPVVRELKHHGISKEARIKGALQGRFEMGKILFPRNSNSADERSLRFELFDFPKSVNDDLSDALAYIGQVAETPVSSPVRKTLSFDGAITY